MQRLIFTWRPASAVCDWLLLDHNGNREGAIVRDGELDAVAAAAAGRELLWLLPGSEALAVATRLPVRGRDKVLRALPYALEEDLTGDPQRFFFALGSPGADGTTQAIALDHAWLRSALAELAQHGLAPDRVIPDYLALPRDGGEWTVLADAGTLHVRTADALGFTLEADTGWIVLARRLETEPEATRPQALRYIRGRDASQPAVDLPLLQPAAEPEPEGFLGVAPRGLAVSPSPNLLQGSFNPRRDWRAMARPWRPAAWALAAVIVLALAGFVASWIGNASANRHLNAAITARFHQILPGQPIVDVRTQVGQRLKTASSGEDAGGMLPLLAALAQARTANVSVESFSYQAGALDVQLHAATVNDLEQLSSAISTRTHLSVTIRSANQSKSGVEGGLGISATPGAGS